MTAVMPILTDDLSVALCERDVADATPRICEHRSTGSNVRHGPHNAHREDR